MVTGSLAGSSMAGNDGFATVDSPFGAGGPAWPRWPPTWPCCTPRWPTARATWPSPSPCSRGCGAPGRPAGGWWPRSSGWSTTSTGWATGSRSPAHRVLAVVEAPFGAHPGGCYAPGLPVAAYGEDVPFWVEAAAAARGDFGAFARTLRPRARRPRGLPGRPRRRPPDLAAGALRPRQLARTTPRPTRCRSTSPSATGRWPPAWPPGRWRRWCRAPGPTRVLAGAGVANLAAWVAVARARAAGQRRAAHRRARPVGLHPTPADPYIFNHRVFPCDARSSSDASTVLGMVVGGPGTTTVGCLGAAEVDRHGNLNSTRARPDGRFLVGSGGANDVASRAAACVVVTLARPRAAAGRGGLRHLAGRPGDQRGDRPRRPAADRRRPAGGRGARRDRAVGRAGAGAGRRLRLGPRGGARGRGARPGDA